MAKSHYVYCRGEGCLLRSNCKRYLKGLRNAWLLKDESETFCWIDKCDEEERELFEPEKKSE